MIEYNCHKISSHRLYHSEAPTIVKRRTKSQVIFGLVVQIKLRELAWWRIEIYNFFTSIWLLKITQIDFKPIGVGRDFLLPFLFRKKGESIKQLSQDYSLSTMIKPK